MNSNVLWFQPVAYFPWVQRYNELIPTLMERGIIEDLSFIFSLQTREISDFQEH